MRKGLRYEAWSLLLACAIGLFAAWPFLDAPGLPGGTDAELHVFRTAELGFSLSAGAAYPRWAPDFYHGYGYPIFNYYAPLTYYLAYALALGRPEAAQAGVKAVLVLMQVLGAVGAYLLGRIFGRRGGGLLGALAFSLAPYVQLINPHVRGAVAESVALGFLPWSLWGWELLWRRGRRALAPAVVATSAVFLSHNLTGLSCVILVAGLGVWRGLGSRRGRFGLAVFAAVAFVLLTAFFWFPFLAERSAVQLNVAGDGHYDFRNHFVPARQLVAWLEPLDRRAASARVPMSAGVSIALLALGALVLQRRERRAFADVLFYAVAAAGCLWLVTPGSQWLWESLPGLLYYQFPWRFLGPAAVCMVPVVASTAPAVRKALRIERLHGAARVRARCLADLSIVGAGLLVVVAGLPGLYPLPWVSAFRSITPLDIVEQELLGRWRGTTSTNDFVPVTVEMIPGPQQSVLDSYRDLPVDRVNRITLPEGTSVRVVPDRPWINRFEVSGSRSFILRLYLFQFPGWHATVDGEEAPIVVAHPEGFITVPVPSGDHEVVVRFGSTTPRTVGWALSASGVIALLAASKRRRSHPGSAPDRSGTGREMRDSGVVAGLGTMLVLVAVAKVLILDHSAWLRPSSSVGVAPNLAYGQRANLDGQVELLGYHADTLQCRVGSSVEVALYWVAQRSMTDTYQSFVHLVGPEGEVWAQSDNLNPGGFPTDLWPTDRYVIDIHRLRVPDDAPPGPYLLSVGLYTISGTNSRLPVLAAECGQRPDSVTLCNPLIVMR